MIITKKKCDFLSAIAPLYSNQKNKQQLCIAYDGKKNIYHGPNHTLNIKMEEVTYRGKTEASRR